MTGQFFQSAGTSPRPIGSGVGLGGKVAEGKGVWLGSRVSVGVMVIVGVATGVSLASGCGVGLGRTATVRSGGGARTGRQALRNRIGINANQCSRMQAILLR